MRNISRYVQISKVLMMFFVQILAAYVAVKKIRVFINLCLEFLVMFVFFLYLFILSPSSVIGFVINCVLW